VRILPKRKQGFPNDRLPSPGSRGPRGNASPVADRSTLGTRHCGRRRSHHCRVGVDSANDFGEQYRHSKDSGAAVLGCIRDTRIIGTGFVSESEISFGIWGLSWLVVDPKFRRQGIARAIVRARELHAANASREGHDTVMQVATPVPRAI